jgi:hypothetical protein
MRRLLCGILALLVCQSSVRCQKATCELTAIKTIFTDGSRGEGGYVHYILVEDFSRACLDSVRMVNMARTYRDTVTKDTAAHTLKFYFSDEDFIPNEESQPIEDINKSALFSIGFDDDVNIETFIFYDDNGTIKYRGPLWKP